MSLRDNRREVWYAPQIIEGPREVMILDEGWVSCLGDNKFYFRPTRGSDGFALYSTDRRASQQGEASERPVKIRLIMEVC